MNENLWGEIRALLHESNQTSTLEDIYDYFDDIYLGNIPEELIYYIGCIVAKWSEARREMSYDIPPNRLEWIWTLAAPLDVSVYEDFVATIHQLNQASYLDNIYWLSIRSNHAIYSSHKKPLPLSDLAQKLHSLQYLCLDIESDGEKPGVGWRILSELVNELPCKAPLQYITATGVRLSEGQLPKLLKQLDQRTNKVLDLRLCNSNLRDEDLYTLAHWENGKHLELLWLFYGGRASIHNPNHTYYDVTLDDYGRMENQFSKEAVTAFCNSPYLSSEITADWLSLLDD